MNRPDLAAALLSVDRRLVAAGFPALSPWWAETLTRFLADPLGRRQLVLRVGRRGGKSSSLTRLVVTVALFGGFEVPPGDVGQVAIVSVSRDEAAARLRTVRAVLDALGARYRERGESVELLDAPVVFRVLTASLAGVVGGTSIAVLADEVARWRDSESGSNPAREVLGSIRPTLATTRGPMLLSSSPLGTLDAHAEAFDRGDDEAQLVAHAPTWLANPTISEAETRKAERDPRVWSREYAAIPQGAALAAFDADAVAAAFRPSPGRDAAVCGDPLLVIDASSGRKDAWTWAVARYVRPPPRPRVLMLGFDGKPCDEGGATPARDVDGNLVPHPDADRPVQPLLVFDHVDGLGGRFWGGVSGEEIIARLVGVARANGVRLVAGDQRESLMIESAFRRHGVRFRPFDWTSQSKTQAVEVVRRWFADRTIVLPEHAALRRELAMFEERIAPSGAITFGGRGSGHDDYVALLVTAALADLAGAFRMSALRVPNERRERIENLSNR